MTPTPLELRPWFTRLAGGVWLGAAATLVLAGVVVVVDQHRLGWELPAGLAAGVLGWWLWHRRLVVDAHGIEQHVGWRRTRLLWAVVSSVEVLPGGPTTPALRVHLTGRDPVVLESGWGLSRAQREELAAALDTASDPAPPAPA